MAFNPYFPATYQNQYMPQYQPQQSGGLIWVQGEAGAKSYPVSAGQSVLLMDSESNRFFIKSADASGMPCGTSMKHEKTGRGIDLCRLLPNFSKM